MRGAVVTTKIHKHILSASHANPSVYNVQGEWQSNKDGTNPGLSTTYNGVPSDGQHASR